MRPSEALKTHRKSIIAIVAKYHTRNARVFGSVLHGNDTDRSDLDLLVDPTEDTSIMDIGSIRLELKKLLDIPVDVLTPGALPEAFKNEVLREAKPI